MKKKSHIGYVVLAVICIVAVQGVGGVLWASSHVCRMDRHPVCFSACSWRRCACVANGAEGVKCWCVKSDNCIDEYFEEE